MPGNEKRGITVKVDAGLHAEIRSYLEAHDMTMGEFISLAAENTLHPKFQVKESATMENARTVAFQVPEELFQRIKKYLQRTGMTQKQFMIGLIEEELERDEVLHQNAENGTQEPADEGEEAEEDPDPVNEPAEDVDDSEDVSGEEAEEGSDPAEDFLNGGDDGENLNNGESENLVQTM